MNKKVTVLAIFSDQKINVNLYNSNILFKIIAYIRL